MIFGSERFTKAFCNFIFKYIFLSQLVCFRVLHHTYPSCVRTAKQSRERYADKWIGDKLCILPMILSSRVVWNWFSVVILGKIAINFGSSSTVIVVAHHHSKNIFSKNNLIKISLNKCDVTILLWVETTNHWILGSSRFSMCLLSDTNWIWRSSQASTLSQIRKPILSLHVVN